MVDALKDVHMEGMVYMPPPRHRSRGRNRFTQALWLTGVLTTGVLAAVVAPPFLIESLDRQARVDANVANAHGAIDWLDWQKSLKEAKTEAEAKRLAAIAESFNIRGEITDNLISGKGSMFDMSDWVWQIIISDQIIKYVQVVDPKGIMPINFPHTSVGEKVPTIDHSNGRFFEGWDAGSKVEVGTSAIIVTHRRSTGEGVYYLYRKGDKDRGVKPVVSRIYSTGGQQRAKLFNEKDQEIALAEMMHDRLADTSIWGEKFK